nr:serine/threonine protein kinase [Myxococcota bacterium]
MTCPAETTLLRYVSGDLEVRAVQDLEAHLDECGSCRFVFAELARDAPGAGTVPVRPLPFELSVAAALPRGTVVGRYVIVGRLGRGGMGVVYKAFDPELDRPIALKLVGFGGLGAEPEEARSRLLREAKTLARLSHPNVVAVHDVGTYHEDVFVAMEFVAGTTLRGWLRERSHKPREILTVFRAAGAGLAAAHRLGIVHRDFKPENVMVDAEGRVRVLDFGLARSLARSAARPSMTSIIRPSTASTPATATALETAAQLTHDGAIVGTPAYMAPEQDRGEDVDARSDQFSFCAALYEALYGQRPFAGDAYAEIAERRLAGEVRPPPSSAVPGKIRRALLKGLR